MTAQPVVSCIMPTANRQKYIPFAIKHFLAQDYDFKELIIIDDGRESIERLLPKEDNIKYNYSLKVKSVGTKRNLACDIATGDIIVHWDDDDWYAPDWLSRQVDILRSSAADICGIEHVNFYSTITDTLWKGTSLNRNNPNYRAFLYGATLSYPKAFWQKNPFQDRKAGEDSEFLNSLGAKLYAHDYIDGFIAILHPNNTTRKYFENPIHKNSLF
jgi:glycosyltransferase involved in cell wall biosynthesis